MELVKHDAIEASDDLTRSDIAAAAGSARIEQEIVDQLRCGEDDLAATALGKLRDMPCVVIRCPPLRQTFFRLTVSGGPAFTQGFAERRIPTLNLPSSHCLGPRLDSLSSSRFDVGQILDDRLDRKHTRLTSSHEIANRMPFSA